MRRVTIVRMMMVMVPLTHQIVVSTFTYSSSHLVVDFSTNQKRICNFLFVININLGYTLPHFKCIAGFLLIPTPPLLHPKIGMFPLD